MGYPLRYVAALLCDLWYAASKRSGAAEGEILERSRSLLRRFPYWAQGHRLIGLAAFTVGDLRVAYASAQALTQIRPTSADSWVFLARCRVAAHQFETAVSLAQKALALDPSCYAAKEELAAALIPLDRYSEAYEVLKQIPPHLQSRHVLSMLSYLEHRDVGRLP